MELKEFITETLTQIAEGIEDAQKRLRDKGSEAVINTNITETDVSHLVTGGRDASSSLWSSTLRFSQTKEPKRKRVLGLQ